MEFMDLSQPEYAYMFGLLQADGHLSWNTRFRGRLSIEVQRADEAILHEFKRLTPYNSTVRYRTRDTNFKRGYSSAQWSMCALEGRLTLLKLGLIAGKKSSWIAPPSVEHSVPDYVRGLIDGDGSVGFTARGYPFVALVTDSAFIVDYVSDFAFEAVGCRRRPMRNRRDGLFNIVFANDPAADLAQILYGVGGIAIERKRLAAKPVALWKRPQGMRRRTERRRWTPDQDAVVLACSVADAARMLGRTQQSCHMRRWRLTKPDATG